MNMNSERRLADAIDDNNRLRVHLVPMLGGDHPWRTRADHEREQRRDTRRFWVTIASLTVATVSTVATALIAIIAIIEHAP